MNKSKGGVLTRRELFETTAVAAGGALLLGKNTFAAQAPVPAPAPSKSYQPVIIPNGVALPWKMVSGVKVYHLIAEEVEHELAPGLKAKCW